MSNRSRNRWLRRALWPITIGILGYLLWKLPLDEVVKSTQRSAGWTIPVLVLTTFVVYVADTLAAWKTFSWFAAPISFTEALVVRGASYLLAVVNYAAGQGAFAWFLHERKGISFLRSAATILLVMGINVLLLLLLASGGLLLSGQLPAELAAQMSITHGLMVAGWAGLAVYVAVVWMKPAALARRGVFEVLFTAGLRGHLRAMLVRIPHVGMLLVFGYLYLRGFGVDVPVEQALLFLPVSFLVAALPLPGQGLGAAQAIMVAIFYPYATGDKTTQQATVFAASIVAQTIATASQMAISLVCLRSQLGRVLKNATNAAKSEETSHGSPSANSS